jgi:hypothetical protein
VLLILTGSIGVGLVTRPTTSSIYIRYAIEASLGDWTPNWSRSAGLTSPSYEAERNPAAASPHCLAVNTRNSVSIRKQLLMDAAELVPRAGSFGLGFLSFGRLGCFKSMSPHNDVLQAVIEFGWLGGAAFCGMIALVPLALIGLARSDDNVLFLLLLCIMMIMFSMVYGQIERDLSLFLVIGTAVSCLSGNRALLPSARRLATGGR